LNDVRKAKTIPDTRTTIDPSGKPWMEQQKGLKHPPYAKDSNYLNDSSIIVIEGWQR